MKVAVYARVSTADKGQDPETQVVRLRDSGSTRIPCDRNAAPLLLVDGTTRRVRRGASFLAAQGSAIHAPIPSTLAVQQYAIIE